MNLKYELTLLRQTRNNISGLINAVPVDRLTVIPDGFRNHLLWNAAHVVVTQQLLCYHVAGLPMYLEQDYVDRYRKDSRPIEVDAQADLAVFNDNCLRLVEQFDADYADDRFNEYQTYPTSYGVTLNSIEDAVRFNNAHEGVHLGYMMAMRHVL